MTLPDLILIFCFLPIAAFAFCRGLTHLRQGSLDYLPTIGWVLCMAVPFMFEWFFFQTDVKYIHLLGICIFTFAFFISDEISARVVNKKTAQLAASDAPGQIFKIGKTTAFVFIAVSLGLIAMHLYSSPNIPLFEKMMHHDKAADIANRFNYYRNISSFWIVSCIITFNLFLFGVPAIIWLFNEKRLVPAFALLFIFMLYAVSGNAKSQLVVLLSQVVLVCAYIRPQDSRILPKLFAVALAGIVALYAYNIVVIHKEIGNVPPQDVSAINVSDNHVGDYYRSSEVILKRDTHNIHDFAQSLPRYAFYRCLITPVEVSARWYQYFNRYPVERIQFSRNILDSRSHTLTHPAKAVGHWAYVERFPTHYLESNYSYTSIDADAYARFGIIGLIIVAALYAAFRIAFAYLYHPHSTFRKILYGSALVIIASLAPSASLQGLLIPNGLGPIFGVMLILLLIENRAWKIAQDRDAACVSG